ncbi:MAG: protoheme IX farnesyltransferase [Bacteroidetes bacterium]|nr:protoheme IX farnesyltransferase [Bacteroidota bacterium]
MSQTKNILNLIPRKEELSVIRSYWNLMKPELTLLSVFTSVGSGFLAADLNLKVPVFILFALALGTLLVGGGAGTLNQYFEAEFDGMMSRTANRPIPSDKIKKKYALIFGLSITSIGWIILFSLNLLTGFLAVLTWMIYVFLYTPLKRISPVSTIIGAIPGALPVLIGWASVDNKITLEGFILFAILYYWQAPHFYSLSWMYRDDYEKAGYRLLSIVNKSGNRVSKHILVNLVILFVAGLLPAFVGKIKIISFVGAALISGYFLYTGILFERNVRKENSVLYARKVFFMSLVYLPLFFLLLVIEKIFFL